MKAPLRHSVPLPVTTEYGKFRFHPHNRLLKDHTTGGWLVRKDLVKSMEAEGYRTEEPITAYSNDDGTLTIIDGHNRLLAAWALNLPLTYIAYKRNGKAEWTPVKSSATQRSWTLNDAVRAYAHDGHPDYVELLEYHERTGIQLGLAAAILSGRSASSNDSNASCRNGRFAVKHRLNGEIVADLVLTAAKFISWATDHRFVSALSSLVFVEEFSPTHLKDKMQRYPEYLEKRRDRDGMLEMLDTLYNKYSRVRFDLFSETRKTLKERRGR